MSTTLVFDVKGMTCDHCVHAVTEAATGVPGVTGAQVDLATNSAKVEGDGFDVEKVIEAIKEEGYEAAVRA
ncbi:MAG: heavy-metal-associated domain-containing protein [Dehalococcoidia bacterium]